MSTVDWDEIWLQWLPSGGAQLITDKDLIADLISFMEYVVTEEVSINPMGIRVKNSMAIDNVTKWVILETAITQLKHHGKAWETHLGQENNFAFEYPIVINGMNEVRYFKTIIAGGLKALKQPQTLKAVAIDYHKPTQTIKVIYVN